MINSCILSGLTESGKYHCGYVFCISGRKKNAKSMNTVIIITKKLYLYRDFLPLSDFRFYASKNGNPSYDFSVIYNSRTGRNDCLRNL